jgi:hypothetical protein
LWLNHFLNHPRNSEEYKPDVSAVVSASRDAVETVSSSIDLGLMQAHVDMEARKRRQREEEELAARRAVEWFVLFVLCSCVFRADSCN